MRYTSRGDSPATPAMHVTIDALLAEARQVERERTLLEVRRDLDAVPVNKPMDPHTYRTDERVARDVAKDMLDVIDRKLAR